jgi:hypothetical protein
VVDSFVPACLGLTAVPRRSGTSCPAGVASLGRSRPCGPRQVSLGKAQPVPSRPVPGCSTHLRSVKNAGAGGTQEPGALPPDPRDVSLCASSMIDEVETSKDNRIVLPAELGSAGIMLQKTAVPIRRGWRPPPGGLPKSMRRRQRRGRRIRTEPSARATAQPGLARTPKSVPLKPVAGSKRKIPGFQGQSPWPMPGPPTPSPVFREAKEKGTSCSSGMSAPRRTVLMRKAECPLCSFPVFVDYSCPLRAPAQLS